MKHTAPSQTHRFAVIGGDLRITHLARRLTEEGCPVNLFGCGSDCLPAPDADTDLKICQSLSKATEGADILVLPLPASRDGETVHTPRDPACRVTLSEISDLMSRTPGLTLFGGKLPQGFLDSTREIDHAAPRVTDYYDNEVLQLRNAYITAEAALMTAMELTDRTLRDTSVAVLGYGRIGKYLARLLRALGADVTVCARREETLFEAAAEGCHPLLITASDPLGGMALLCRDHPILFNTVPAHILPRDLLMSLRPDTLLIDLASAPFGVSDTHVREATAKNGLRYLRAPSLPGSYAPRDAGRAIAECILGTLAQRHSLGDTNREGGTPT